MVSVKIICKDIHSPKKNTVIKYLKENYILDEEGSEIISLIRILNKYNNDEKNPYLSLEKLKLAIYSFSKIYPFIEILPENKIKGLKNKSFQKK